MKSRVATNQSELARLCEVSAATISRYVDLGLIPVGEIKLGRRSLYSVAQIESIASFFRERTRGETLGKFRYDLPDQDMID